MLFILQLTTGVYRGIPERSLEARVGIEPKKPRPSCRAFRFRTPILPICDLRVVSLLAGRPSLRVIRALAVFRVMLWAMALRRLTMAWALGGLRLAEIGRQHREGSASTRFYPPASSNANQRR